MSTIKALIQTFSEIFQRKSQTDLEFFIASQHPKCTSDVEHLIKSYCTSNQNFTLNNY